MTYPLFQQGFCAGHRVRTPAFPSIGQAVLLRLGLYEVWFRLKWKILESL